MLGLCWRPQRHALLVSLLVASCIRAGFGPGDGGSDDGGSDDGASLGDASGDQMTTPYRLELTLTAVDPVLQMTCRQIDLTIKDPLDRLATLPAAVDVLLSTDASGARLFTDSGCRNEANTLSVDSRSAVFFSDDGPRIARAITVTAAAQDSQVAAAHLLVQTRARATALAVGEANSCAVAAGAVQCWGSNVVGELGDGTRKGRLTPTEVTIPGNATSVVTNGYHSCAIAEQKTLFCWGRNNSGQVGDGSRLLQLLPTEVTGISDVSQVALGSLFTCALSAGEVYCWGNDWAGQLGNGAAGDSVTPKTVQGLSGVVQLGIGSNHGCALLQDDSIACWGANYVGQLGNGNVIQQQTPVAVVGLGGAASFITAGATHTCAVVDGGVQCWGRNGSGQLGTGDDADSTSPLWVSGLGSGSGVTALVAGKNHACAVVPGGLRCWGDNRSGQLGDGTFLTRTTPVVTEGVTRAELLAAGEDHTCALVDGVVFCWGRSDSGQLGRGQPLASATPRQIEGIGAISDGAAGDGFTCALRAGAIDCWGSNALGQLGDGTQTTRAAASQTPVQGLSGCLDVTCGANHACAIADDGVWCWGQNENGLLGTGSASPSASSQPVQVSGLSSAKSTQLTAFDEHTCALTESSGVWCWGTNNHGQLGNDSTTASNSPVQVVNLPAPSAVGVGWSSSCAAAGDQLACWGRNTEGQCATGTSSDGGYTKPQISPVLLGPVSAVTGGYRFACAVGDGAAMCWGHNGRGELGDGSFDNSRLPVPVQGLSSEVTQIAAGISHACALVAGEVWCWGDNASGQVGHSDLTTSPIPRKVGGLPDPVSQIFAGWTHSCAVAGGHLWCWGSNTLGELGEPWPGAMGAAPIGPWEVP